MNVGSILCGPHGGIAEITDNGVQAALAKIQTCTEPSNIAVVEDLGGGSTRFLAEAELVALLDATGGVAQELVGLEVTSAVVRGVELDPNPRVSPAPIPISAIFSDEDGDGSFVGGQTGCPPVPIARSGSALTALALLGVGWWRASRGPFGISRAGTRHGSH